MEMVHELHSGHMAKVGVRHLGRDRKHIFSCFCAPCAVMHASGRSRGLATPCAVVHATGRSSAAAVSIGTVCNGTVCNGTVCNGASSECTPLSTRRRSMSARRRCHLQSESSSSDIRSASSALSLHSRAAASASGGIMWMFPNSDWRQVKLCVTVTVSNCRKQKVAFCELN